MEARLRPPRDVRLPRATMKRGGGRYFFHLSLEPNRQRENTLGANPHAGVVSHRIWIVPPSEAQAGVGSHRIPLGSARKTMLQCCLLMSRPRGR